MQGLMMNTDRPIQALGGHSPLDLQQAALLHEKKQKKREFKAARAIFENFQTRYPNLHPINHKRKITDCDKEEELNSETKKRQKVQFIYHPKENSFSKKIVIMVPQESGNVISYSLPSKMLQNVSGFFAGWIESNRQLAFIPWMISQEECLHSEAAELIHDLIIQVNDISVRDKELAFDDFNYSNDEHRQILRHVIIFCIKHEMNDLMSPIKNFIIKQLEKVDDVSEFSLWLDFIFNLPSETIKQRAFGDLTHAWETGLLACSTKGRINPLTIFKFLSDMAQQDRSSLELGARERIFWLLWSSSSNAVNQLIYQSYEEYEAASQLIFLLDVGSSYVGALSKFLRSVSDFSSLENYPLILAVIVKNSVWEKNGERANQALRLLVERHEDEGDLISILRAYVDFHLYPNKDKEEELIESISQIKETKYIIFTHGIRAQIYQSLGKYHEAIADYNRLDEMGQRRIRSDRGDCYEAIGQYDLALKDFQSPSSRHSKLRIAKCHRALGDYESAKKVYDEFIGYNPKNAGAFADRGEVHQMMRNYTLAIEDFDTAIRLDPTNMDYAAKREACYLEMGEDERNPSNSRI